MPLMMEKLYDALKPSDEAKARAAAVEVAEFDRAIWEIKSTQRLHSWILTFHTGLLLLILAGIAQILIRLPH